jgi:hypothetical protein
LCARAFTDAGAILVEAHIPDPMESILDRPMAAAQREQAGGCGPLGGQAAEALHGFPSVFLRNHLRDLAPDGEDLRGRGEVQISAPFRAGPEGADFHAAMPFINGCVLRGE